MSTWNDDDNRTLDGISDEDPGERPRPEDGERYEPGESLGAGGMGEVRLALDRKLRREVALKVLKRDGQASRERFFAEAQVTAQLEHPNIVPVHDIGTTRDGRPFLVMKVVRGAALSERAAQLSLAQRLEIFRKVCDAVAFAHARGVLHRDIKPENVMVGEFGEVLLMDWGLARASGGDRHVEVNRFEEDSRRTRAGQVTGTPAFMAPEQAEGRTDALSERTDVYGLGALLYELLTGKAPFSGLPAEVIEAVKRGAFPSPRSRDPRLPRELDAVVLRAMALRPADRYPAVSALREDIDAWLSHRPLVHVRSSAAERLAKWAARHRQAVGAATAVGGLALALLILGLGRYARDVGEARDAAVAEADRARTAEATALEGLIAAKVSLADALSAQGLLAASVERLEEAVALAEGRAIDRRALDLALSIHAADSPPPLSRCQPHGGAAIVALAISPDGTRALSQGADQRVLEWSVTTCAVLRELTTPGTARLGAVSLADGRARFAVVIGEALYPGSFEAGWGPAVPLGAPAWRLRMQGDTVSVGLRGGRAALWRGGALQPLPAFTHANWLPDPGSGLVLGISTGTTPDPGGVWDAEGRAALLEQPETNDVAASPSWILHASSMGCGARITGAGADRWTRQGRPVTRVGLADAAPIGYALGFDDVVELIDLERGEVLAAFKGPARVTGVGLSADARVLSLGGADGRVLTFLRPRGGARRSPATQSAAHGIDVSRDGAWLVIADVDGVVRRVDSATGRTIWASPPRPGGARAVAISPDGARIAVAQRDDGVAVLDAADGAELARGRTPGRTVSAAWQDNDTLWTVPIDGTLIEINARTGEARSLGEVLHGPSWDLTPWPGGGALLATHLDQNGERVLLDPDGQPRWRVEAGAPAYHHAVSPDGRLIAIACHNGTVELRQAADGSLVRELQADGGPTMVAAFSPDGALLATGGFSEQIMLWDPATGERLRAEHQHVGPVLNLAFSPDGAWLWSVGADGGVATLPLRAHIDHAAAVAGLSGDPLEQARAYAALTWWERVPEALDAAVAAGLGDDPELRTRAALASGPATAP